MKRMLPSVVELGILAGLALLCAILISGLPAQEGALAVLAFPLLLTAMLMGARRTGKLAGAREPVRQRQRSAA